MAYINHKFCWHGVISTDVDKSKAFFTEVIGWSAEEMQMGDETSTMFVTGGAPIAHLMAPPMPGVPSHVNNYLRVEDVDASTAKAIANGGTCAVPATDIPPGRFSVITSPSGAMVSLFKEADPSAQNHPATDKGFHWVELHSTNIDADVAFLKATFGFDIGEMPMPNGMKYYLLNDGDTQVGGAMPGMNPDAPAFWLAWISIDDVDAAATRVTNHGGTLLGEAMDMPGVGRMVVAQDPTGVTFGLITPAAQG